MVKHSCTALAVDQIGEGDISRIWERSGRVQVGKGVSGRVWESSGRVLRAQVGKWDLSKI